MYQELFSPITINKLTLKNRIAYPSLGLLYSYDRMLNDRYFHFYREIAGGGAGLVTVGPVGVDYTGSGLVTLSLATDDAIPCFQKITGVIRKKGASPWIQLFHGGAYVHPFLIEGNEPIAPSPVYSRYSKTVPREMDAGDIETVKDAFAAAAVRAREAGFEGVEIIGSAGYLISQFLSPQTNRRTDQYGGNFENRARFPMELLGKVRSSLGADFPLTVRMSGNDFVPDSNGEKETREIARLYEENGADALNVTGGWHESRVPQLPMEIPRGGYAYLARNIRDAVSVPVLASGRITTPDKAEKILREGFADMVNLGRVLIADPHWPTKAAQGRPEEIRPCVGCSQGCSDQVFSGKPVFCVGNPRAGFEEKRRIKETASPKRVMVAGAGLAGLEAAVTAARIGHRVELYEKSGEIGGQLRLATAPPGKGELREFIRYYRAMLNKYEIPFFLNTEVTEELVQKKKPDHLIVAEGASPLIPEIRGTEDRGVFSAWEVLEKKPKLGRNVAVIGGGSVGLETALFAASKSTVSPDMLHFLFTYEAVDTGRLRELMFEGRSKITLFEMQDKAGKDTGKSTKWVLLGKLERHGVTIQTGNRVFSVENRLVAWERDGKLEEKQFDTVILATGARPLKKLTEQVDFLGIPYTCVGDTVTPGKFNQAIHGGFLAALAIG